MNQSKISKSMTISILSLSLLTVMAGAAVAPALGVLKAAFSGENELLIQLIISLPALFIFLTNLIFPKLSQKMGSKTLVMLGLGLYVVGGVAAGFFDNIFLLLIMRALVGIGVGILMPLSTGLLAYYYPADRQAQLSGYASAMNQAGGAIATLIAGVLASLNWRASFLVYLMGLISVVLCLLFLPNDSIAAPAPKEGKEKASKESVGTTFKKYYKYIIGMFLLMNCFFIYPSNYAIQTVAYDTSVPANLISVIMACLDVVAFFSGFFFVDLMKGFKGATKFLSPVTFLIGYLFLYLGGLPGGILGGIFIGFANGCGVPFLISQGSMKAGRSATTTIMPLISAALYLGQFVSPFIMSGVSALFGEVRHLPYLYGMVISGLFFLWSVTIKTHIPGHAEEETEEEKKESK